jgi:hypothetical protein
MIDGVGLDDAERIVSAFYRAQPPESESDRVIRLLSSHDRALNRGRVDDAGALAERLANPGAPWNARRSRVRDALYGDGDTAAAVAAVREMERTITGPAGATPQQRNVQHGNLCYVELWRLAHGDTRTVAASLARLRERRPPAAADSTFAPYERDCTITLTAIAASLQRWPDAAAHVERLDSLAAAGPSTGIAAQVSNLVVARLRERAGDRRGALAALRRREYFYGRVPYLSTFLREEGRLAALTGDREGAIAAYRQYVALRADADPELRPHVDQVRAEIGRLERESVGR